MGILKRCLKFLLDSGLGEVDIRSPAYLLLTQIIAKAAFLRILSQDLQLPVTIFEA